MTLEEMIDAAGLRQKLIVEKQNAWVRVTIRLIGYAKTREALSEVGKAIAAEPFFDEQKGTLREAFRQKWENLNES